MSMENAPGLSKVPEVTLLFWIIKILTTTQRAAAMPQSPQCLIDRCGEPRPLGSRDRVRD